MTNRTAGSKPSSIWCNYTTANMRGKQILNQRTLSVTWWSYVNCLLLFALKTRSRLHSCFNLIVCDKPVAVLIRCTIHTIFIPVLCDSILLSFLKLLLPAFSSKPLHSAHALGQIYLFISVFDKIFCTDKVIFFNIFWSFHLPQLYFSSILQEVTSGTPTFHSANLSLTFFLILPNTASSPPFKTTLKLTQLKQLSG